MDKELKGMFDMVLDKIDKIDGRIDKIDARIDKLDAKVDQNHLEVVTRIEHDLCKRIDTLFDGYKLNHEKQWELQHQVDKMEQRLATVELFIQSKA